MILKKAARVLELNRCAAVFELHGHSYTSKWILFLANNLEKNLPSDYHKDYLEILDAFKIEISKEGAFHKTAYTEIELILGTALKTQRELKFSKILSQCYPLIKNWRKTRENITNIYKSFIEEKTISAVERNYYLLLFSYMLEIEGSYDEIIRALYILALASKDCVIDVHKTFNQSIGKIKREFLTFGYSDTLFKGWEDGHLRNSIAHARFHFSKETGKIKFIDKNPRTDEITYQKNFSYEEFAQKGRMIAAVSHIFVSFIILIRILDLVKYKWITKKEIEGNYNSSARNS